MRGTREPSYRKWHSADLLQLHWHVCMHRCVCVCGSVYDARVAGGTRKCMRGVRMVEMMKRVFFRDALNKNNNIDEREQQKHERNTPSSCL